MTSKFEDITVFAQLNTGKRTKAICVIILS